MVTITTSSSCIFEEGDDFDRSHEDHGTKLTNVVSKFNELAT